MTASNFKGLFRIGIPLILVALFAFAPTQSAEAGSYRHSSGHYGRYGHYGHHGYGRGYYGHGYGHRSYYGYGRHYSPYSYGGYSHYPTPGGLDLEVARLADLGALDLNVKPRRRTRVYLDG